MIIDQVSYPHNHGTSGYMKNITDNAEKIRKIIQNKRML